eukprot:CAMPEP_0168790522 /NCGR_PEP_ID=MMETSP0725-20121227/13455_1 /TAXON_ID=265536 /ORGANISM="Amphiprora sp., Strain CCMP467" /LENGTH=278 /DNA_ID=CAMNT_0008840953 /DNA_START=20 /DNA_END=852 /DNA_ORIENTATION=+
MIKSKSRRTPNDVNAPGGNMEKNPGAELVKSPKKKKGKKKKTSSSSSCRRSQLRNLSLADSMRIKNLEEDQSSNSDSTLIDVNQYSGPAHMDIISMMGTVSKLEPKTPKLKMRRRRSFAGLDDFKKAVTFKCNKKGKIKPKVKLYERHNPLDAWWTDCELASFRESCIRVVESFQQEEDYLNALEVLYKAHLPVTSESSIDEASHLLAEHAAARGLEMHIGSIASPIMQKHQCTIAELADDLSVGAATLRKQSRVISKPSRVFATAMAEFDAQEAAVV